MTVDSSEPVVESAESAERVWPNPKRGFLFFFTLAPLGTFMAVIVPGILTIPLKASVISPENPAATLSLAVGIPTLLSLIAFPLFGRFSDRIIWSGGRRRPLLFIAAGLLLAGGACLYFADSVPVLVLAASLLMVGGSAGNVAFTSIIPDQIEPLKRGPASAIVGMSIAVGTVIGLFLVQLFPTSLAWGIFAPNTVGVVGILLLAIILKDKSITRDQRPTFDFAELIGTFWTNPVKNPNFAWTWASRFLMFFGVATLQSYQTFYLIFALGYTAEEVPGVIFLTILALTIPMMIFATLGGKISDVVGRRKPFVIGAAIIFAVGLSVAALSTSFEMFLVAMVVMGIGQGVYFAVDIALVTQVLPDPDNPAKDMGIFNLAGTLPGTVVPAIAPAALLIGATAANPQNYPALFIIGAIVALIGAALILPIRGVK